MLELHGQIKVSEDMAGNDLQADFRNSLHVTTLSKLTNALHKKL
jgi:hypothetical protein